MLHSIRPGLNVEPKQFSSTVDSVVELNWVEPKNLNNKLRPVWSVVTVMSLRGFNIAEVAEKSTVSYLEEFLLANAIHESRRRHQNLQIVLKNLAAWRRKVLNVCFLLLLISSQRNNVTPVSRCCCRLTRNIGWWENTWNNYSEARFKKTFRVSHSTFRYIFNCIGPFLARETVTEDPISPELRLALCLYRLGRRDYFYIVAEMAGLGVSTVCSIVNEVCQVLVDHLQSECVSSHMPKTQDDFKKKC